MLLSKLKLQLLQLRGKNPSTLFLEWVFNKAWVVSFKLVLWPAMLWMKDNGTRRFRPAANSLYKVYNQNHLHVVRCVVQLLERHVHIWPVTCLQSMQKMTKERVQTKTLLFITSESHSLLNMFLTCRLCSMFKRPFQQIILAHWNICFLEITKMQKMCQKVTRNVITVWLVRKV